jgi:hypothetical protein
MAIAIGIIKPHLYDITKDHTNMDTFIQNFIIFGDVCGDFIYAKLMECSNSNPGIRVFCVKYMIAIGFLPFSRRPLGFLASINDMPHISSDLQIL